MALYNPQSPVAAAQAAMGAASQTAAAQTKQTTRTTKKDTSAWDDFLAGATGVARLAQGLHGLTNAAEDVGQMYGDYKLRDAYDAIDKTFAKEGLEGIQSNPDMQDYWHSKALGQFMLDRANNEKGRLEMMKNMDAANDKLYQDWRIGAIATQKAFNSGDMQRFMPAMQELSAKTPIPYRLDPDGNGNFRVMFRSDAHGGWTDTGQTMSPQEAMEQVNSVMKGERMILRGIDGKMDPVNPIFGGAIKRSNFATQMINADNKVDIKKQIQLVDRNGRPALGVIQNPLNGGDPILEVYGYDKKRVDVFDGLGSAMQAGFRRADAKTKGSGDENGPASKAFHVAAAQAGFLYDSKNKWYYAAGQDADGKWQADLSRPMSKDATVELNQKIRGTNGASQKPAGDSLGIRGNAPANAPAKTSQPAPAAAPLKQNDPRMMRY